MIEIPDDIDPARIPAHIAVIMDGNGRWAKRRGMRRSQGHLKGAERVRPTVEACLDLGVRYLTLYAFSSENWRRPALEKNFLWRLLYYFIRKEIADLRRQGLRFNVIGDITPLPPFARKVIENAVAELSSNERMTLTLAINYGGRNEILRAARNWCRDVLAGKTSPDDLDDATFSDYLYTAGMPDPDLLIRTAGEMRLSNFLLYQSSYAELYITDVLWPDFDEKVLLDAIRSFQRRVRRMGGLPLEEA